jgi:hypothetical protein
MTEDATELVHRRRALHGLEAARDAIEAHGVPEAHAMSSEDIVVACALLRGPCTAENRDSVLEVCREIAESEHSYIYTIIDPGRRADFDRSLAPLRAYIADVARRLGECKT